MKNIKIGHCLALDFLCITVLRGIGAARAHRTTVESLTFMHDTTERH
jgi:hypothetical protein